MTIVVDASERRNAVLVTVFEPIEPRTDFRALYEKTDKAWEKIRTSEIYQIINLGDHDLSTRAIETMLREVSKAHKRADFEIKPIIVSGNIQMMHVINDTIDRLKLGQTPVFDGLDDAYSYIDGAHVELGARGFELDEDDL